MGGPGTVCRKEFQRVNGIRPALPDTGAATDAGKGRFADRDLRRPRQADADGLAAGRRVRPWFAGAQAEQVEMAKLQRAVTGLNKRLAAVGGGTEQVWRRGGLKALAG